MSENDGKKGTLQVVLGAAFLMATSAIGPGFLTQTTVFTCIHTAACCVRRICHSCYYNCNCYSAVEHLENNLRLRASCAGHSK